MSDQSGKITLTLKIISIYISPLVSNNYQLNYIYASKLWQFTQTSKKFMQRTTKIHKTISCPDSSGAVAAGPNLQGICE